MSFRRSAPAISIAAVVVVLVLSAVATNRLFDSLIDQIESDRFALMHAILVQSLADAQGKALARAEIVASMTSVRHELAAKDRDALLAESADMYAIQHERFGLDQAQFTLPPALSYLRLNAPDKGFMEDLSAFRPMVVEVNSAHQPLKGVSIGRSGPAVFGMVPIADDAGQHVGSFEMGLQFGPVLDSIKAAYGLDAAVFFEEQPLREIATLLGGDVLGDSNRVGRYIRFHTTDLERMRGLVTDRDLASTDERNYVRDAEGVPYGVVLMPLNNFAGKPLGMIAVASDFTSSRASASRMMVWQGLLVLIGSVLCGGLLIVIIRGMVLRPMEVLTQRFTALAAGDRSGKVAADDWCDEMQALARAYDDLRGPGGEP
jgi:methyl-accepting chemotaxis protein